MDKVFEFFRSILGASWFMKTLGILSMVGGGATLVKQGIEANGVPTDTTGLIGLVMFIMGAGQLGTKQTGVTNAKEAMAVPQPVLAKPGDTVVTPPVVAKT
jgi:hypothetical protein